MRLRPAPAVVRVPPSFSAERRRVRREVQQRREAEHRAGGEADDQRERENAEVERDIRRSRQAVGIGGDQRAHADDRDAEAERRAGERQHAALRP